jgi:hypothetical protein
LQQLGDRIILMVNSTGNIFRAGFEKNLDKAPETGFFLF